MSVVENPLSHTTTAFASGDEWYDVPAALEPAAAAVAVENRAGLIVYIDAQSIASSAWFDSVRASLEQLGSDAPGWDSYEALPTSPESIEDALTFLATVLAPDSTPPALVPLSDGGIQLEWHRGGLDVEVAFSPDEEPEMYVADHVTGDAWDFNPDSPEFEVIRPLLTRLRAE